MKTITSKKAEERDSSLRKEQLSKFKMCKECEKKLATLKKSLKKSLKK